MDANMDAFVFLQKNKNTILNMAIIILALIISIKIYQNQDTEITVLKTQKDNETENNKVFKNLTVLDNKINAYKRSLKIRNAGEVMNIISEVAKSVGLKINSIRPLGESVAEDYVKLPVSVDMRVKSFDQIGKFMSKLESNPAFFTVDSFKISRNSDEKALELSLSVSVIRIVD